jgi:hypothetical protein
MRMKVVEGTGLVEVLVYHKNAFKKKQGVR